jgi:hypothetical protein
VTMSGSHIQEQNGTPLEMSLSKQSISRSWEGEGTPLERHLLRE